MGSRSRINEYGVSIGNEAVFTKSKNKKHHPNRYGLLELALERTKTAKQASEEIIRLLLEYGQGGNCTFDRTFYYDNSYIIADKEEAYILETAGKNTPLKK